MTDIASPTIIDVEMLDAGMTGWYLGSSLYPGFEIRPEDVVLDVGCGGGFAAFCGRQGAHIIFCDIVEGNVAHTHNILKGTAARELTPIVVTSERLPLPDATATRIICSDVLEHVADPQLMLSEAVRVAKPGALFIISVPDPVSESLQKRVAPPIYFERPNHVRIFGFEDIEELVRGSGLVIERHDRNGFYFTLMLAFFWSCPGIELATRDHPLLHAWAKTWWTLLNMAGGHELKANLDSFMPSRQMIIARKPEA